MLVASAIPATAGPELFETGTIELGASETKENSIEAPTSHMALAALDPLSVGTKRTESERIDGHLVSHADGHIYLSANDAIIGIASFYDDPQPTASGEQYDPNAYTAAAQLEIRHRFAGIKYGRLYQPAYGLGEYLGKKIIVRFNDVGPLRPGRKFDLSRAAMAYFDSTLEHGLLTGFKVTPLPLGRTYPKGPITDEQLAALGIYDDAAANICDDVLDDSPIYTASTLQPTPQAARVAAKPVVAAKPAVASKRKVVAKRAAARSAAKRAAAKAAPPRRAAKPKPARGNVKVAAAAPKTAEQTPKLQARSSRPEIW
jgi:rare lipoprotein A